MRIELECGPVIEFPIMPLPESSNSTDILLERIALAQEYKTQADTGGARSKGSEK
jgi:hypothetical protein